jgi:hypothetical protein
MSTIDRRAFVVGCLAVPLAGCANPGVKTAFVGASPPIAFQNNGSWQNYGNAATVGDEWVYVVTPGFKS